MLANKTELQANSRKFFMKLLNANFSQEANEDDDFSFQKFESNVKFINWTALGEIFIPIVADNTLLWQMFLNQLAKSKAVILSSQEPISSLVDHSDFRSSISIGIKKKIKEYIDETSRVYVKRNSFKVIKADLEPFFWLPFL